jgi:hypothetical protein
MVLHSEVKSGKWLILFQNMMDSGMGTSAKTATFYGSGQVAVEGPEPHQGGGRQGGGGASVTQRPVFTSVVVRGAKKKFNWGPKNESVSTAFWFFWLFSHNQSIFGHVFVCSKRSRAITPFQLPKT